MAFRAWFGPGRTLASIIYCMSLHDYQYYCGGCLRRVTHDTLANSSPRRLSEYEAETLPHQHKRASHLIRTCLPGPSNAVPVRARHSFLIRSTYAYHTIPFHFIPLHCITYHCSANIHSSIDMMHVYILCSPTRNSTTQGSE